ncbi:MAG TPA: GYF domain-containing protein [Kofleriaceae bacterium]|nr:GYF domain-containing protein [Kofleriaceae bacterium]
MKFFCDKCKTRYSIGDDRVRGKILKIRCKNCANVITVRESMDGAPAGGEAGASGSHQAISAFASAPAMPAMQAAAAKPPPALEEEWYVSIDGVQTGPLSLSEAQKWVGAKPIEADLHCWSEGFDDWLPVDKVSHFRGLRKAALPPPGPGRRPSGKTVPPPIPEKPLFAATMASIEKSASQSNPSLPSITSQSTKKGMPAIPAITAQAPGAGVAAKANGKPMAGGNGGMSAGAAALAQAFQPQPADSMTNVESPAFNDEQATSAEPVAATKRAAESPVDPFFGAQAPRPVVSKADPFGAKAEKKPVVPIHNDADDDMEIGEVSRVVNLKDLAPSPKPIAKTPSASFDRLGGTGSVQRIGAGTASSPRIGGLTGSSPKLSPSELGMNVDPALAQQLAAQSGEPMASETVVAQSFKDRHRRGLMALIGISAVIVVGVVLLFVFVVNNNSETYEGGLGGTRQIDTSRPEDIVRKQLPPAPNAGNPIANNATKKWLPRPNGGNLSTGNQTQPELPGNSLKASEVEDMAAKNGEGTKRCYMRAQKGALGFEIQDVKKIAVTLSVNKDGTVGDVQLSEHGKDEFGQCLITRIKGWRFRESAGGTFRISLAFSNG